MVYRLRLLTAPTPSPTPSSAPLPAIALPSLRQCSVPLVVRGCVKSGDWVTYRMTQFPLLTKKRYTWGSYNSWNYADLSLARCPPTPQIHPKACVFSQQQSVNTAEHGISQHTSPHGRKCSAQVRAAAHLMSARTVSLCLEGLLTCWWMKRQLRVRALHPHPLLAERQAQAQQGQQQGAHQAALVRPWLRRILTPRLLSWFCGLRTS